MSETSLIEFHGVEIEACEHSGIPYANLRRMCECLGVGYGSQRQKLMAAEWAVVTMIVTTGADGKQYQMAFLSADCVPMWLATIQTSRIREDLRPLLRVFQQECRDVLFGHFSGDRGLTVNGHALAAVKTTLQEQQQQLVQIFKEMAEISRRCQRNEERMVALVEEMLPAIRRIDDRTKGQREDIRNEDKDRLIRCVGRKYSGMCPCCRTYPIVKDCRRIPDIAQFDHYHHRSMASLEYVWLVCKSCNRKLRDRKPNGYWMRKLPAFQAFQELLFEQATVQRLLFAPPEASQ